MKTVTDLELLNYIYNHNLDRIHYYDKKRIPLPEQIRWEYSTVSSKDISEHFDIDKEIIEDRLLVHINTKYAYFNNANDKIEVFKKNNYKKIDANYGLIGSILAELREKKKKEGWGFWIAIGSLIISIIALVITAIK